jgi:hypothetical protein
MMWPSIVVVGHFLLFTVTGVVSWPACLLAIWLILGANVLWLATGLYFSLRFRSVTVAIILNLLAPVCLYLVPMIVLAILGGVIENRPDTWAEVVALWAPYPYIAMGVDELSRLSPGRTTIWMPVFHRISVEEFLVGAILCGSVHLAAAAGVIWYTVRRFNRIVGRAR